MQETQVQSLAQDDPLEKEMATHPRIPAWRIPWTGEPGGLQSTGSQRVRQNWVTNSFHFKPQGPLCRTGNYTPHCMPNPNGKEYEHKYIHMHNWIALLQSRDEHSIVNQLHFHKTEQAATNPSLAGLPSPWWLLQPPAQAGLPTHCSSGSSANIFSPLSS